MPLLLSGINLGGAGANALHFRNTSTAPVSVGNRFGLEGVRCCASVCASRRPGAAARIGEDPATAACILPGEPALPFRLDLAGPPVAVSSAEHSFDVERIGPQGVLCGYR